MQDATTEQHQRLRSDMYANSDRLKDGFEKQLGGVNTRLSAIELTVNSIQTERELEDKRAGRTIALYSIFSGVVVTLVLELLKLLMHRP